MSRESQWTAVIGALHDTWPHRIGPAEVAALESAAGRWEDLAPLVAAVEHFQTTTPGQRPAVNELVSETRRRRRLANAKRDEGQPKNCGVCADDGWQQATNPRQKDFPDLVPCPACRPATHHMWSKGHYNLDAPTSVAYEADSDHAKGLTK